MTGKGLQIDSQSRSHGGFMRGAAAEKIAAAEGEGIGTRAAL